MMGYRVRYCREDRTEDFMEFGTMEQAREFYDSMDGQAEIQEWNGKWGRWWTVIFPTFEF